MAVHTLSLSTQEAEAGGSLSLRPAKATNNLGVGAGLQVTLDWLPSFS